MAKTFTAFFDNGVSGFNVSGNQEDIEINGNLLWFHDPITGKTHCYNLNAPAFKELVMEDTADDLHQ